VFVIACSDSDDIDFFEPGDDTMQTGGSAGTSGGSDAGGSSNGGTTSTGGSSGDESGGTAGTTGGSAGNTGGSQNEGGSDAGGTGGTGATGGTDPEGGSSGTGADGGMATGGTGGSAGDAMGGSDAGGAGMGGTGMGGAGMGGAGTSGAGMSGAAGAAGCVPTTPSTERCDGVDNNCTGGVDEGMACPANCTGATRAGHSYMFCSFENASGTMSRERTWMQALDFCQMRDLGLVFIESAEENAFILEWVKRMDLEDQVWIGATDRDLTLQNNEGDWVWGTANNAVQFWDGDEDGEAVMDRYEDWAEGEPNNDGNEDCGALSSNHEYQWDDRNCSDGYMNFVCESGVSSTQN
jgi:hypothetical protein